MGRETARRAGLDSRGLAPGLIQLRTLGYTKDDLRELVARRHGLKSWVLEGPAQSARGRRAEFIAYLERLATPDSDLDAAAFIYGELVGNVIRHVGDGIRIAVEWGEAFAVLRVRDGGPGFQPAIVLPDGLCETGRGLYIVKTLARELEVRCEPSGCEVRAVLPVRRQACVPHRV